MHQSMIGSGTPASDMSFHISTFRASRHTIRDLGRSTRLTIYLYLTIPISVLFGELSLTMGLGLKKQTIVLWWPTSLSPVSLDHIAPDGNVGNVGKR